MPDYDCDLFVIGAGSGGVRAARMAAGFGAKVVIAENHRFGGTCVIRGCVPKKLLMFASHFAEDFEDAAGFGWSGCDPAFSWPQLIAAKDREIARLSAVYERLLSEAGVQAVRGTARIVERNQVEVAGRSYRCRHILVATGGSPSMPPIPGIEHALSSNEVFDLPELPRRVLVVGGGYIAVEFAGIFNGLGAQVALSYRGERVLRGFDDDVRAHLAEQMARKGVDLALGSHIRALEKCSDGSIRVEADGFGTRACEFDVVLYATGRTAHTNGLGLEKLGVALDAQGGIVVDRFSVTNVPGVHAVGDVTHRVALTPVAIREGAALATTLFGGRSVAVDHDVIPSAVFSQPPIGTVGLTEQSALQRHTAIDVYLSRFRPMRNALSGRDEATLIKLVVDAATERVLGAHMVGPDAPEIIQGIAIAVRMGATKADFDATIGVHPTAAEEFVTLRAPVRIERNP